MSDDKSLPIIDVAYRLAFQLNKAVVKFPRHQRPGLGRRTEETAFNFLEALTAARYRNLGNKATFLTHASNYLDNLRLCVRMCFDLGYLPHRSYEELARIIAEAGRMLGGWQKSQKQSWGGIINEFSGERNSVFPQSPLCLEDDKEPFTPRRIPFFLF